MKLSEELKWRGFVNQTTLTDLTVLDKQKWTFYHGFDASADSQTVGNLAAMMLDRLFMRHGHHAVILAGGATSLIGDPGGKDSERPLQDEKTITKNVAQAERQLKKVFSGYRFKLVNNITWTKKLSVTDYLRDVGKHFSMTPLVQRDYIAKRLGEGGSGMSYAEFSYTVLQGLDYLHLFDKHKVTLQLGGSDQWGNLLSGVELIRKTRGADAHAITMPLVVNQATGKKFGKTEEGAIWLDPAKTSAFQFYQFWLNVDDDGVGSYLKIFTELDQLAIANVMTHFEKDRAGRLAQKALAYEVTKLVHGKDHAVKQTRIADALVTQNVRNLGRDELAILRAELPTTVASGGVSIVEVLVKTGLAASNSEARRLLNGNAVYINNQQTTKENFDAGDFASGKLLLRKGKAFKDSALIEQR